MSEAMDAWLELARRATESKFSGIASDSNDLLSTADIREGKVSPGGGAGRGADAAGNMMPPMMMGGMGGMGAGAGAAGAGRLGGMGGAAGPGAAGAGAPAARIGGGLPQAKEAKAPESDMGPMAASAPSGGDLPSAAETAGGAVEPPPDGIAVEGSELTGAAELWAELGESFKQFSNSMHSPESLGLLHPSKPKTDDLADVSHQWCSEAAEEFQLISTMLVDSARSYQDAEDEASQAATVQEQ